jgi:hypothetical protein
MKKAACLLLLLGILMWGSVSSVLAEKSQAEGIRSGTSISDQAENSFFSKDNLNLLAAGDPACNTFPDILSCIVNGPWPRCCWEHMNSVSLGDCRKCK